MKKKGSEISIKELQVNPYEDMNPFYGSIACFPILLTLFMCGFAENKRRNIYLFDKVVPFFYLSSRLQKS